MTQPTPQLRAIIHATSAACAGVGGGLAQVPGSDAAAIVPLQTAMILGIARELGVPIPKGAAADLVLTFSATMTGRAASQVLVGWFPGIGNLINASTAFGITEAVGWAAYRFFLSDAARKT